MITIQEHLWRLGVGKRFKGYQMIVIAVELGIENENRLQCVQEFLYKPIARQLGCNFRSVERNIRTVIAHAWNYNPAYLSRLAGVHLAYPPTVSQFLDILVSFSLREKENSSA